MTVPVKLTFDARLAAAVLLVSFMALGLFIRVQGNSQYALNPDETMLSMILREPSPKGSWSSVWRQAHPPLMSVLLHGLMRLSLSELSLRCVSLVPGTLLILASYLLGRSACGGAAGLTMAALAAFGSGPVLLSQLVRPYALLLLFLTTAFWALLEYLRTREGRWLCAYALCAALSLCSHYAAVMPLAAMAAVWAGRAILRGERGGAARAAVAHLPAAAALGALYFLQLSSMDPATLGISYYGKFLPQTVGGYIEKVRDVFAYLFAVDQGGRWLALAAAGAVHLAMSRRRLLLGMIGGPLLIHLALTAAGKYPLGYSRHSAHLFPTLALLIGAAAQGVCDLMGGRLRPPGWALTVCAATGLILSLAIVSGYRASDYLRRLPSTVEFPLTRAREGKLFALLADRARAGDLILTNMMTWHYFTRDSSKAADPLRSSSPIFLPAEEGWIPSFPATPYAWVNAWRGVGCVILGRYDFSGLRLGGLLQDLRKNGLLGEAETVWLVDSGWKRDGIAALLDGSLPYRRVVRREFSEGASGVYSVRTTDIRRLAKP